MKIKNIHGEIIYSCDCETIKETVEKAVKEGISLAYADLRDVDLTEADLRDANLSNANLCGANLRNADLHFTYLRDANLSNANLIDANLRNADLHFTYLNGANLSNANLIDANLRNADLHGTNLHSAVLCGANIREAYLLDANLSEANLSDAYLLDANLSGANLEHVCLYGARNVPNIPTDIPSEGELVGWKKVEDKIIKLQILEDSKRTQGTTDKCRCDKALVLEIQNLDGTKADATEITNNRFTPLTYKVGEVVYADWWDDNRWYECSHGIHFFVSRQRAVKY